MVSEPMQRDLATVAGDHSLGYVLSPDGSARAQRPAHDPHATLPSENDTMAAMMSAPVTAMLRAPVTSRVTRAKGPVGGGNALPAARPVTLRSRAVAARASADVEVATAAQQAVSDLAVGGIDAVVDTTSFDEAFVNIASFILPAWGAIVGTIFVFGTIAKIAFPDKYDAAVYKGKAEELVADEIIDLDNLSPEDIAAVEALEAERAAQKQ